MKVNNIEIIEENNKYDFERLVAKAIENRAVADIKFAVTPDIHSSSGFGGSYSAGETYYAMIMFE